MGPDKVTVIIVRTAVQIQEHPLTNTYYIYKDYHVSPDIVTHQITHLSDNCEDRCSDIRASAHKHIYEDYLMGPDKVTH